MSISRKLSHNGQMSEAFCTAMFLSVSGGLQDVYTYLYRGKVFANAQTGNIVLCSVKLVEGDWSAVLHYLVPLCFFALGVFTAELLRQKFQQMQRLHWRQLVVLCEIVMLFVVGFFPQEWNLVANALVSFACAMQVQAFRKVNGYAFASTMCIGDLRSGVEALCIWCRTHEPRAMDRMLRYFGFKRGRKGKKLSRGGKGNTAEELQYYRRKSKSHESGIERNKKGCTGSRAE